MKITTKNVEKIYAAILKHFKIDDFYFRSTSSMVFAVVKKHKFYKIAIDHDRYGVKELSFKWYQLCDSATCFYIESVFPNAIKMNDLFEIIKENTPNVLQLFVRKMIDVLLKHNILLMVDNNIYDRIPKINSLEELMILSDIN